MKPVTPKKLNLSSEFLRLLTTSDLKVPAGGKPPQTHNQCGSSSFRVCC